MSRCAICDYSQSADSSYHSGLQLHSNTNNRVIYSKALDKDICLTCLDDYNQNKFHWDAIDETADEVLTPLDSDEDVSEYSGCTDKPTD